jgi:hypothetical protein
VFMKDFWTEQVALAAAFGVGILAVLPLSLDHAVQSKARNVAASVIGAGGGVLAVPRIEKETLFLDPYTGWKKDPQRIKFMERAYTEISIQHPDRDLLSGCDRHRIGLAAVQRNDLTTARHPAEAAAFFDHARRAAVTLRMYRTVPKVREAFLTVMQRMYA